MGWIYVVAALVFPPVFVLWRPREPVPPSRMKVRVAGAVVVVWMLLILWSMRGVPTGAGSVAAPATSPAGDRETVERWEVDAPSGAPLAMLLGWVPGLVYAGLLILARKSVERPAVPALVDQPRGARGRPRKRFAE